MTTTDWKSIVATVAPQLANLFGGPLAGMAVSAIAAKLLPGKANATEADVAAAVQALAPADLIKLREVQAEVTKALADAGVKIAALDQADRDSARTMQEKVNSWTPTVLAVIIVIAWGIVQWYVISHAVPAEMQPLVSRLLGTFDSILTCVIYFYFGSSASSRAKDQTIKNVAEAP